MPHHDFISIGYDWRVNKYGLCKIFKADSNRMKILKVNDSVCVASYCVCGYYIGFYWKCSKK